MGSGRASASHAVVIGGWPPALLGDIAGIVLRVSLLGVVAEPRNGYLRVRQPMEPVVVEDLGRFDVVYGVHPLACSDVTGFIVLVRPALNKPVVVGACNA